MSKAIRIDQHGGPEQLTLVDVAVGETRQRDKLLRLLRWVNPGPARSASATMRWG